MGFGGGVYLSNVNFHISCCELQYFVKTSKNIFGYIFQKSWGPENEY